MNKGRNRRRHYGLITAAALFGVNLVLFMSALKSEALAQSQTPHMQVFEVTGVLFLSFACFMYSIFLSGTDDRFVYRPPVRDPIRRQRRMLIAGILLLGLAIAYAEISVILGYH